MGGKIIHKKNFLCQEYFRKLQSVIMSQKINWFLREMDTLPTTNNLNGYFTHNFYNRWEAGGESFQLILPLLNEIKCANPIHMRANLTLRKEKTLHTAWHTDVDPYNLFDGQSVNFKTALFYLNTNNGSTLFDKKELNEVEAIANRLVVFDANVSHCNKYSTNTKDRIVINFNYV